ncbi:hypothetical protein [Natrialba sp. SSL1]|uniref:hypothetical protein n=1 Tax=Natrialba sp. SSL1 TaxID=1869245 RepID=UPI0011139382|nr:hypothetical protein [Natrialba sp. SSL1]
MTIRKTDNKVIQKLLYQRRFADNPVSPNAVTDWFPAGERERVEREIKRMTADPDVPLKPVQDGPQVCLSSIDEVLLYLDKQGADIPSGLEAFVQSPPLHESRV